MIIVVYLVGPWETFHRRPMLESLAGNLKGKANIVCVNPITSLKDSLFKRQFKISFKAFPATLSKGKGNLFILTPRFIFGGKGWEGKKRFLVENQVKKALKFLSLKGKVISWVYRPEQVELVGLLSEDCKVYECYDEYSLSHIDGTVIPGAEEKEERLIKKVDLIFTTAHSLFESREGKHPNVYYAPNGVDFALFNGANFNKPDPPRDLEKISSPRIGYIGNLSGRIDFSLLEKIAKYNASWSLILIGPFEQEAKVSIHTLMRYPNIHYLGYKPYQELPQYLKRFDVCILPFKKHAWNEYSNPLKLWQYLAAGKPVISTRIKEMEQYKDLIYLAENADEFSRLIKVVTFSDNSERVAEGIRLAKEHSWESLTRKMAEILTSSLQREVFFDENIDFFNRFPT